MRRSKVLTSVFLLSTVTVEGQCLEYVVSAEFRATLAGGYPLSDHQIRNAPRVHIFQSYAGHIKR